MDTRNLIELLEATTKSDPVNLKQAEERLSQVKKNEFCHVLSDLSDLRIENWIKMIVELLDVMLKCEFLQLPKAISCEMQQIKCFT